jgi:hypothetical protein
MANLVSYRDLKKKFQIFKAKLTNNKRLNKRRSHAIWVLKKILTLMMRRTMQMTYQS